MTDQPPASGDPTPATVASEPSGPVPPHSEPLPPNSFSAGVAPGGSSSTLSAASELAAERPEVAVGAAFAGGLLLAIILKRLGR